jgi:hypothetical protein
VDTTIGRMTMIMTVAGAEGVVYWNTRVVAVGVAHGHADEHEDHATSHNISVVVGAAKGDLLRNNYLVRWDDVVQPIPNEAEEDDGPRDTKDNPREQMDVYYDRMEEVHVHGHDDHHRHAWPCSWAWTWSWGVEDNDEATCRKEEEEDLCRRVVLP